MRQYESDHSLTAVRQIVFINISRIWWFVVVKVRGGVGLVLTSAVTKCMTFGNLPSLKFSPVASMVAINYSPYFIGLTKRIKWDSIESLVSMLSYVRQLDLKKNHWFPCAKSRIAKNKMIRALRSCSLNY